MPWPWRCLTRQPPSTPAQPNPKRNWESHSPPPPAIGFSCAHPVPSTPPPPPPGRPSQSPPSPLATPTPQAKAATATSDVVITSILLLANYSSLADPWAPAHSWYMSNHTQQEPAPCEAVETRDRAVKSHTRHRELMFLPTQNLWRDLP